MSSQHTTAKSTMKRGRRLKVSDAVIYSKQRLWQHTACDESYPLHLGNEPSASRQQSARTVPELFNLDAHAIEE